MFHILSPSLTKNSTKSDVLPFGAISLLKFFISAILPKGILLSGKYIQLSFVILSLLSVMNRYVWDLHFRLLTAFMTSAGGAGLSNLINSVIGIEVTREVGLWDVSFL